MFIQYKLRHDSAGKFSFFFNVFHVVGCGMRQNERAVNDRKERLARARACNRLIVEPKN